MKYLKFFKMLEKKDHIINRLDSLTDDQKQDAIDFFNTHPNFESEIDWNRKDLTWEDFEDVFNKERVSKSQLKNFVKEGIHYLRLYTSRNLIVYQPLTYMGSMYVASKDTAPGINGKWCIAYQKDRNYWEKYSFKEKKVFLILCTDTTKWALEISQKGSIQYWDATDTDVTEEVFKSRITQEVPDIAKILKDLVPKAIRNFDLVNDFHRKDLDDTDIFEENQRLAREALIKAFPKSFKRQIRRKGYYQWDGDITYDDLMCLGLVSNDCKHLDERIKRIKIKGDYDLSNSIIEEIVWPLAIEKGSFKARGCRFLKSAIIPDSVKSIDTEAFSFCSKLAEIVIPDGIESIEDCTFYSCTALTKITIPNSVKSIGESAFESCTSLKELTIPDSVTSIGPHAFDCCSKLSKIHLPNSITSIGHYAFSFCVALKKITIPTSITELEKGIFNNCKSLKEVSIPDNITSIGNAAFSRCESLTEITIPNSVTSIGEDIFWYCTSLAEIDIPNSVTSIGSNAFWNCSNLESIYIPGSVNSIGSCAFWSCSSLKSIYVDKDRGSLDLYEKYIPKTTEIYWKGEF